MELYRVHYRDNTCNPHIIYPLGYDRYARTAHVFGMEAAKAKVEELKVAGMRNIEVCDKAGRKVEV